MPTLPLPDVVRIFETVSEAVRYPVGATTSLPVGDELEDLLRRWHDLQLIVYFAPEEVAPSSNSGNLDFARVQFPNSAYARVALRAELTEDRQPSSNQEQLNRSAHVAEATGGGVLGWLS